MLVPKADWLDRFGIFYLLWELKSSNMHALFRELLSSCFTSGKPREIHQENESKTLLVKDHSLDSCRGRSKDNEGSQLMVVHNF